MCELNSLDICYREYLETTLYLGFGQIRKIDYEKTEFVKPSIVILSPNLETSEHEIAQTTEKLTSLLENLNQYRKRYAVVHTEEGSYIIGGYIFDSIKKSRIKPDNDFKYNSKNELLETIEALPNMIVSFGIATDGKYIVIIGGHTPINKPLAECYLMEIKASPEKWINLPDLPIPISGSGVGMINGQIHVIGGFDILSSESLTHGEYYRLTFGKDNHWQKETSLEQIRARSLVLLIPKKTSSNDLSIYVAGGYHIDIKRHPNVVSTVYMYDDNEKLWKFITNIPNLKLTDGLSFFDDKLHVSESLLTLNNEYELQLTRTYDFETNQWIECEKN